MKEGSFYLWTQEELTAALGPELSKLFRTAYSIPGQGGNCILSPMSDPHQEFVDKSVPIMLQTLPDLASELQLSEPELLTKLATAHSKLHAARSLRPRPGLDDKVVTAWNGMAISAFALASRALSAENPPCPALFPVDGCPRQRYLEAAKRIAGFVRANLYDDADGTLLRSFRNGPSAVPGFCDDYAHMVSGLLELYECGGGVEWLQWAVQLQATQDRLFLDAEQGGYFSTSGADPSIRIRIKDDYDSAEPAPSSVSASNLLRLASLLPAAAAAEAGASETQQYSHQAQAVLAAFQDKLRDTPLAVPKMCCAAHLLLRQPLRQVIVAGPLDNPQTQSLLDAVHTSFTPDKVVLIMDPGNEATMQLFLTSNPQAVAMVRRHFEANPGAGPTAFICQNYTCQAPTNDPASVASLLKANGPAKPKVMTEIPFK